MHEFQKGRRRQNNGMIRKVQAHRPVKPFEGVALRRNRDWYPGNTERIRYNSGVHGVSDYEPCLTDTLNSHPTISERIEKFNSGQFAYPPPVSVSQRFIMRHKDNAVPLRRGQRLIFRKEAQQCRAVYNCLFGRQIECRGCQRTANRQYLPFWSAEVQRWRVVAHSASKYDVSLSVWNQTSRDNRADSEHNASILNIQREAENPAPQPSIQVIAKIAHLSMLMI